MGELKLETKLKSLCDAVLNIEMSEHSLVDQISKYKDYELDKYVREVENQRQHEYKDITTMIDNICEKLNEKLKLFQNNSFPEIEEIPKFKNDMLRIQKSIEDLKTSSESKLNELRDEEATLVQDLKTIKEGIEKGTEELKKELPLIKKNHKKNLKKKKILLDRDTQEFVDFIEAINDQCKISNKTIVVFYKIAKNSKDLYELSEKILDSKPDLDNEVILFMCQWYTQFKHLKEQEKNVFNEWRIARAKKSDKNEVQKNNAFKKIDDHLDVVSLKENLWDWKKRREQDRKAQVAYNNFYNMETRKKEMKEYHRRLIAKKQIRQWQKECEKIDREQKMKEISPLKPKQTVITKKIKQYQKRDEEFVLKMRQARTEKTKKEVEEKRNKFDGIRDPKRIHKLTKQWINRIKDKPQPRYKPTKEIREIQKLKIPDWRIADE